MNEWMNELILDTACWNGCYPLLRMLTLNSIPFLWVPSLGVEYRTSGWRQSSLMVFTFHPIFFFPGGGVLKDKLRHTLTFLSIYLKVKVKALAVQSCPTLFDPMNKAHQAPLSMGFSKARILEWVAMTFSRGSSQPGIEPRSPMLQADSLLCEPSGKYLFQLAVPNRKQLVVLHPRELGARLIEKIQEASQRKDSIGYSLSSALLGKA